MERTKTVYQQVTDETGETLYCPTRATGGSRAADAEMNEDCVEASTVGRYSGNLEVVDRFAGLQRE
jgi:hypothetical protein